MEKSNESDFLAAGIDQDSQNPEPGLKQEAVEASNLLDKTPQLEQKLPTPAERLLASKIALRGCMLLEYAKGNDVFEAYEALSEVLGEEFMNIREFDYFFHKLGKGELELDSGEKFDPNALQLSTMPVEIVRKILMEIEPIERFPFRRVCSVFRNAIDSLDWNFKTITLSAGYFNTILTLSSTHSMIYTFLNRTDSIVGLYENGRLVENGGAMEKSNNLSLAIMTLSSILKSPLFTLDTLVITETQQAWGVLFAGSESIPIELAKVSPLLVTSLQFIDIRCEEIVSIVRLTKSGTLKEVSIRFTKPYQFVLRSRPDTVPLQNIVELEQWKHLEKFDVIGDIFMNIPIDSFLHLTSCIVRLVILTTEELIKIRDILMESSTFEVAVLNFMHYNLIEIGQFFNPAFDISIAPRPIQFGGFHIEIIAVGSDCTVVIYKRREDMN